MKFRIISSVNSADQNQNVICRSNSNKLEFAVIETIDPYHKASILEISDELSKSINWKISYPIEHKDSKLLKDLNINSLINLNKLAFDQFGKCYYFEDKRFIIGFVYMKNFDIRDQLNMQLPKLHLSIDCESIDAQVLFDLFINGSDNFKFTLTNSIYNTIIDRNTNNELTNQKLSICKICSAKLFNKPIETLNWIRNYIHA